MPLVVATDCCHNSGVLPPCCCGAMAAAAGSLEAFPFVPVAPPDGLFVGVAPLAPTTIAPFF